MSGEGYEEFSERYITEEWPVLDMPEEKAILCLLRFAERAKEEYNRTRLLGVSPNPRLEDALKEVFGES